MNRKILVKDILTNNLMIKIYSFFSNKGWTFFKLGVFFILSAPVLASFFLLLSLFLTKSKKQRFQIKKKWILPFFVSGVIAIISAIFSSLREFQLVGWDSSLSWFGLMNWIPFYFFMWRAQFYLNTVERRKQVGNMFLAGSVPLIFSGFGQMWFNWHGPFTFLNGLIIWFQRSIDFEKGQGISAMFNNQNYAACWLIIIWPFCIYSFLNIKKFNFKKLLLFIFTVLLGISVYLTQSRNGIIGTSLSTLFLSKNIYLIILLSTITITFLGALIFASPINEKFFEFTNLTNFLGPRVFIYSNALPIILERPFFGWGAASFPLIFQVRNQSFTRTPTHPHNLILEMANSYGLIFATLVFFTICLILFYSYKSIFIRCSETKNEHIRFNKAWWASFFSLFLSQMYDIQYFDVRISISFWILLTGLINMI